MWSWISLTLIGYQPVLPKAPRPLTCFQNASRLQDESQSPSHRNAECITMNKWKVWAPTPVFLPGESQGRGAWWAAVYGVAQSRTWLKRLSSSSSAKCGIYIKYRSSIYRNSQTGGTRMKLTVTKNLDTDSCAGNYEDICLRE